MMSTYRGRQAPDAHSTLTSTRHCQGELIRWLPSAEFQALLLAAHILLSAYAFALSACGLNSSGLGTALQGSGASDDHLEGHEL